MRKDMKTGMLLGVVLAVVAVVIISIYSATVESRLQDKENGSADESNNEPKIETGTEIPPLPTERPDKIMENRSGNILIHTVAPGETLSAISTLYYGTMDRQQKILDANADIITNANRLRPGMRLRIP